MKNLIFITIVILTGAGFSQSIDETLQQISALKKEIADNTKLVEEKISDLKRTNPLFADQDAFESDAEYLGRMSRAMPQLDQLRKQYLNDLWTKMSILRGRMFETHDISVTLHKDLYDPNTEMWPIVIQHHAYQEERFEITINIDKTKASTLYKNWDKVQKMGILTVDVGDKIGLGKFRLNDPISGFEFTHEFTPMHSFEIGNEVQSVAFSPDGKFLAIGSRLYNKQVLIYNLETGNEVNSFNIGRDKVNSVAFSPDGKFLAAGSNDQKAYIYNLETGNEVNSFAMGVVKSVAFSPDGKFLAAGSTNYKAYIYNLETGNEVNSFSIGHEVHSVAFSPDGKFLAIGSMLYNKQVLIYNLETGNEVNSFNIGRDKVNSVAFSPDGKFLAAGSSDKKAHIYNLETGKEANYYGYDKNGVFFVSFSDDGRYLAVNSKGIDIYDLSTNQKVRSFGGHRSIDFSPDGKYLATCYSKTFRIYRTFFQVEEEVLAQKAISRPPSLSASVSFSEPSGNKFLDAMEKGELTIIIKNSGQGPGKGILVKITPERTENLDYNNTYIEEILPGKSISVNIPIEAYVGIASADHTFRFDFEEINGFPPGPAELQFSTRAYLKPEMYIVDVGIEDGNSNGKIESGEMITLTVRIGNQGKGTAKNAYAKFYSGDNVFITQTHPKTVKIGELSYNGSLDIPLEFFVNDNTKDNIPLYVDFTEETNLATVSKLRLPISKSERTRQIGRTVVTGIEQEYGELTLGADLSIDIEQNIPDIGQEKKHSVAIIIGNKNYSNPDVPQVTFAHRDAAVMEQYLSKTLGYKDIIIETDATQGKFFALFGTEKKDGKLQDYIKKGKSDVFIYYSGHGAPDPESKDGYFVPVDCDPMMVDVNGYSLDLFYNKINNLGAKSVTVVIDACFSGSSDQGMLLKNISPVFIEVDETGQLADEVTVFTSSSGEQVSSWYPEKKHSLYTYFFLKGLKGSADVDENQSVTAEEMQFYVNEEVGFMARKLNSREQTPGLRTLDEKKVLIQY